MFDRKLESDQSTEFENRRGNNRVPPEFIAFSHCHCNHHANENSLLFTLIAGATAGTAERSLMFPVDTIKTHIQAYTHHHSPKEIIKPINIAFNRIISQNGTSGLFRGLNAILLGVAPSHAIYFATYEFFKKQLITERFNENHSVAHFTAGVLATVISDTLITPMDSIKQKMQLGSKSYTGVLDCIKQTWRTSGLWRGFYSGYTTTLTMNIPYSGTYFASYEFFKYLLLNYFNSPSHNYDHSNLLHIVAGAGSGIVSAALTNPLDVARTRLQTQSDLPGDRKYKNMIHTLNLIWKEERFSGLASGMLPRMVFHSASAAICWACYEYVKFYLAEHL